VVVEPGKEMGRDIFIRLVDEGKGGWGHINFDNFVSMTSGRRSQ